MLVGPVFTREVVTAPRRARLFISRAAYVLALLVLMCTAWLVLAGTQTISAVGDVARFGSSLFPLLACIQLALAVFFSALLAASAVSQEKDRRTLILLLLTNLTNSELVLGKLLASLLNVLVLLAAALPLLMLSALLGGIGFDQIARVMAVTVASALAAGSLGSTLALWREKTFQTLALTTLAIVFWLAGWEIVRAGVLGAAPVGIACEEWASWFSPWRAMLDAVRPMVSDSVGGTVVSVVPAFAAIAVGISVLLNLIAIGRVRVWNPSRQAHAGQDVGATQESIWGAQHDLARDEAAQDEARPDVSVHAAPGKLRRVWNNPILWRETRTWAYGRKVLVIRAAYLVLFALAAVVLHQTIEGAAAGGRDVSREIPVAATALIPLFLLSLMLINAMAVTSITTERDGRSLDLLLVTDLTAKEIIFGKLGGVFYNTKEMVILPLLLIGYLRWAGGITTENLIYLMGGLTVINLFGAVTGIHVGMNYFNSRSAIAVSQGTLFFLTLGIVTCMWILFAFRGSFPMQLQPFLAFMLGGGVGLYLALGGRHHSRAIALAAFGCPIATFYAITCFLLDPPHTLAMFSVVVITYAFTTAAMLVPALHAFDVEMEGR
ncbi:MAG: hypothetical protein IID44_18935 [Planctomycetes bacterium]|nr:hypothetical protein [Planctomycetota bacterium]